jgi:hypothetical protein
MELTRKQGMDDRMERPEYGAGALPSRDSEYLRNLKQNGEASRVTGPSSSFASMAKLSQKTDSPPGEKRRSPRYKCEGSAEFRTEGFDVRTWARVTDLSRTGCYVEMQATFPLNTAVSMVIEVNGTRVHAKGTVKTCYPLWGMGIEFTEVLDKDVGCLEEILRQLAGGSSPDREPESLPVMGLLMSTPL